MLIQTPRFFRLYFIFSLVVAFTLSPTAPADVVFIVQKQEAKRASRWSLDSWLDQRRQMAFQDMWLVWNTKSPYEFFLQGMYHFGSEDPSGYAGGWKASVGGFAHVFGISIEKSWFLGNSSLDGFFHLRLFGHYVQGTHLMLSAGASQQDRRGFKFWTPLAKAHLNLYLYKTFGISGSYLHGLNTQTSQGAFSMSRLELQAFLDFSLVRFFGGYFSQTETGPLRRPFSGIELGTTIFL